MAKAQRKAAGGLLTVAAPEFEHRRAGEPIQLVLAPGYRGSLADQTSIAQWDTVELRRAGLRVLGLVTAIDSSGLYYVRITEEHCDSKPLSGLGLGTAVAISERAVFSCHKAGTPPAAVPASSADQARTTFAAPQA
jgi:hypothetical protein